jgi:hypothetical protein
MRKTLILFGYGIVAGLLAGFSFLSAASAQEYSAREDRAAMKFGL